MGEWKLVPVEPTEEMVEDGELTLSRVLIGFDYALPSDGLSRVYGAMLAASPAPFLPEDAERVVERLKTWGDHRNGGIGPSRELYRDALALIRSLSSQLAEAQAEIERITFNRDMFASREAGALAERDRLAADVSEFMTRLGPRWFLDQGWFPASQQEEKRAALDTAKGAEK